MKSLILLAALFAAVSGAPVHIRNLKVLVDYAQECKTQSGIDLVSLLRVSMLDPPDHDPKYKDYIFCYLKKMGYLTDDANLRTDTSDIEKWLNADEAKESLDKARRLCDEKGERPTDTADLFFRCSLKYDV